MLGFVECATTAPSYSLPNFVLVVHNDCQLLCYFRFCYSRSCGSRNRNSWEEATRSSYKSMLDPKYRRVDFCELFATPIYSSLTSWTHSHCRMTVPTSTCQPQTVLALLKLTRLHSSNRKDIVDLLDQNDAKGTFFYSKYSPALQVCECIPNQPSAAHPDGNNCKYQSAASLPFKSLN